MDRSADMNGRLATQTEVANALHVTSQQVDTWRNRRRANGFPEPVAQTIRASVRGGKRHAYLWDLDEVLEWHRHYDVRAQRARGGNRQR